MKYILTLIMSILFIANLVLGIKPLWAVICILSIIVLYLDKE